MKRHSYLLDTVYPIRPRFIFDLGKIIKKFKFITKKFNTVPDLTGPWFEPQTCRSRNAFVSGAAGQRYKSQAGQIGHNVASGSQPLRQSFKRSCVAQVQWRGDGPRKIVIRFGVIQRVYWKIWFEILGRLKCFDSSELTSTYSAWCDYDILGTFDLQYVPQFYLFFLYFHIVVKIQKSIY